MTLSIVSSRSTQRRLSALSVIAALSLVGCTSTTIEKSAQPQDANAVFERQLQRASRFQRRGFDDSAERHYSEAIATAQDFRTGDPREADARSRRAELRLTRGNYPGAEQDYVAVVALRRRGAHGIASPVLADALNNLAIFYTDLGRVNDADPLLREAIAIRIALYGKDHPYVAVLLQNLGDAMRRERRYESAEELLVSALAIYLHTGEDFYREASIAQNNLARVYRETHRSGESEKNHLNAIRLSIKAGGEYNPDIGVFSRDLANLYVQTGRIDEAEGLYKGSIAILRDALGERSYQLSKTYRDYSAMLQSEGRRRESAYFTRRADETGYE